jgi:hypothetical protein
VPKPPVDDEVLGHLDWDDTIDRWSGNISIASDVIVELSICSDGFSTQSVLENARRTFLKLRANCQEASNHIADRLLGAYNESWNDGSPVSRDQFLSRISPAAIGLYHDGSAEFLYEDGGQFGGHLILIYVSAEGDLEDVTLEG